MVTPLAHRNTQSAHLQFKCSLDTFLGNGSEVARSSRSLDTSGVRFAAETQHEVALVRRNRYKGARFVPVDAPDTPDLDAAHDFCRIPVVENDGIGRAHAEERPSINALGRNTGLESRRFFEVLECLDARCALAHGIVACPVG